MPIDTRRSVASRRRLVAAATSFLLVVGLLVASAGPVAAATVKRTWTAKVSTNGTAQVVGYTDGLGRFALHLGGLKASTSYPIRIVKGTCASPGTTVFSFVASTSTADGRIDREHGITATHMNQIWSVDRTGSGRMAIRVGSGSLARCGNLRYPVATRVAFPYVRINIAVIRQNSGSFPYCGVAMYLGTFGQPREPWATMLYAHARTGMFLPLLTASKVNNGAAMIGKSVRVYTSDSEVYVYRVRKVIRHTLSMAPAFAVASQQVWLQTSEGPYRTSKKLFVVAKLTGVYATTYAASHPRVRPYSCS